MHPTVVRWYMSLKPLFHSPICISLKMEIFTEYNNTIKTIILYLFKQIKQLVASNEFSCIQESLIAFNRVHEHSKNSAYMKIMNSITRQYYWTSETDWMLLKTPKCHWSLFNAIELSCMLVVNSIIVVGTLVVKRSHQVQEFRTEFCWILMHAIVCYVTLKYAYVHPDTPMNAD